MNPVPLCRFAVLVAAATISAPLITGAAEPGKRTVTAPAPVPPPAYADIADLVIRSPVVVDATVRSTKQIKGAEATNLAPGHARLLVTADVGGLLRGPGALPPRIEYLLDLPADKKGRPPQLRKHRVLLFARPVAKLTAQIQLTGDGAQRDWTAPLDALTRKIIAEVVDPAAPPAITGIGNAFHVPGSLPGDSETQIFLTTADARPVSLSIIRRPGEQARWSVALSEIVDEAAAPPVKDTLLWYRLACFLPPVLPDRALSANDSANADAARVDYQFVLKSLGPCGRTTAS